MEMIIAGTPESRERDLKEAFSLMSDALDCLMGHEDHKFSKKMAKKVYNAIKEYEFYLLEKES